MAPLQVACSLKSRVNKWYYTTKWVLIFPIQVVKNFTWLEKKFSRVGQQLVSQHSHGVVHDDKASIILTKSRMELTPSVFKDNKLEHIYRFSFLSTLQKLFSSCH